MARRSPVFARALIVLTAVVAALALPAFAAGPAAASQAPNTVASAADQALGYLRAWNVTRADPSRWDEFVGVDPDLTALADGVAATRLALAQAVAPAAGVPAEELDATWRAASEQRVIAVYAALSQVGVPYRRNATSPGEALDCSGLTAYAWGEAGVGLAHQSGTQIRSSAPRSLADAQPGDLVWYPGHVMLYLGAGNAIVHAPYTGKRVEVKQASHITRMGSPLP
jgi:cell wall-associated NlpC family hydrolase